MLASFFFFSLMAGPELESRTLDFQSNALSPRLHVLALCSYLPLNALCFLSVLTLCSTSPLHEKKMHAHDMFAYAYTFKSIGKYCFFHLR